MADRVGSDNPAVPTIRATVVRRGGTRRVAVEVPTNPKAEAPGDGPIRLSLDGQWRHAPVEPGREAWTLLAAHDSPRMARERAGTDRLAEWVADRDLEAGRSVLLDVVEPGRAYGLRAPGETAVYEHGGGPAEGLRRIAEDLES